MERFMALFGSIRQGGEKKQGRKRKSWQEGVALVIQGAGQKEGRNPRGE